MLKRGISWNGDGFTLEANPKLTEKLLNMLNLSGGKGALTPGGEDIRKDGRDIGMELEYSDAKLVQAAAGLEQYIALDRPDIAYSVKTALQQMSKLTKLNAASRGPSRSLLGEQSEAGLEVPVSKSIDVFVDADFAARETMLRREIAN